MSLYFATGCVKKLRSDTVITSAQHGIQQ